MEESDFQELGVTNPMQSRKLLAVVRSGDPMAFIKQHQAREAAASAYERGSPGGFTAVQISDGAPTTMSYSGSAKLPRRPAHPHLKLPGRPSSTPKRSPCSPVRAPHRAGLSPKTCPGLRTPREWNKSDISSNLRIKSKLCHMDRPKFPKEVITEEDSAVWRFYVQQEQRAAQRLPTTSDGYGHYFTDAQSGGRP